MPTVGIKRLLMEHAGTRHVVAGLGIGGVRDA